MGRLLLTPTGKKASSSVSLDGHGIRMWKRAGLKVAFLSGRKSSPTRHHAKEFAVDFCLEDCHDKLACLRELMRLSGLSASEIAYVGDDLPDLPVIRRVGFGVAVAGAVEEVRDVADYVTTQQGGKGAVREVIEYILKKTGRWEGLMKRYLSAE